MKSFVERSSATSTSFGNSHLHTDVELDAEMAVDFGNRNDFDEDLVRKRPLRPSWNPNISVLELAYKLRRAEQNVFGHSQAEDTISKSPNKLPSFGVNSGVDLSLGVNNNHLGFSMKQEPVDAGFDRSCFGESRVAVPSTSMPARVNPWLPLETSSFPVGLSFPNVLRKFTNPSNIPVPVSLISVGNSGSIQQQALGNLYDTSNQQSDEWASLKSRQTVDDDEVLGNDGETPTKQSANELRHHQCKQCTYRTKSMHHLRRHCASVHTQTKPYQCYVCSQEFARSEKVREHFVSFHPDVAYDPKMARKFCPPAMRDVSAPMDAKSRIRELFRDIEGEDMEFEVDRARPYGCLRCGYATRDFWHLRRHVLDVHAMRKQHNCPVCRYATNRSNRLIVHMRGHGELFCEYCSFSSTNLNYFMLHDKLCSAAQAPTNTEVNCPMCGQEYGSHADLCSHVVESHGVETVRCDQCPYFGYNKDEFVAHTKAHLAMRRTCKLCAETFASDVEHDMHDDQVHLSAEDGVLVCTVCADKPDMEDGPEIPREHVRSHSPERMSCGHGECKFKACLEQSVTMHTRYYHDAKAEVSKPLPQRSLTIAEIIKPPPVCTPPAMRDVAPVQSSVSPVTASPAGTFACSVCGSKRAPFKYFRSYEKHMAMHGLEPMARPIM